MSGRFMIVVAKLVDRGIGYGDYTPGDRWHSTSGATNPVNVQGAGTVDAKKGDRIVVTGIFRLQPPGERMIVEAVIEKLEP